MNKIVQWVLVIWLLGITVFMVMAYSSKPAAYVDLNQVYQNFDLTKELTEKYDHVKSLRKIHLDSLEVEILKLDKESEKYNKYASLYGSYQQDYTQEIERLGLQYDDQIWKQINTYVKDFGSHSKYDIILGVKGEGQVMYGAQDLDVTDEMLTYINKKYEGD